MFFSPNLTFQAPLLLLHLRLESPELGAERLDLVVEQRRPLGARLARSLRVCQPVRRHAQLQFMFYGQLSTTSLRIHKWLRKLHVFLGFAQCKLTFFRTCLLLHFGLALVEVRREDVELLRHLLLLRQRHVLGASSRLKLLALEVHTVMTHES